MAELKLKEFAAAKHDCTQAIQLDASYTKAYLRRASAYKELGQLLEAAEDYEHALRLEPTSKVTVAERRACLDLLFQQEQLQHQLPRTSLTSPAQQPTPSTQGPSSKKPDVAPADRCKLAKNSPVVTQPKADKPDAQSAIQRPTQPPQSVQQPFGRRGTPSCVIEELPNEPNADSATKAQPVSAPQLPTDAHAVQSNKKQRTKQQISNSEQAQKPEATRHERTVLNAVQSSSSQGVSASAPSPQPTAVPAIAKEAKTTSLHVPSSGRVDTESSQPKLKPPAPPADTPQQALKQQTAPTLPEAVASGGVASSSHFADSQTDAPVQSQSVSASTVEATPMAEDTPTSLPVSHAQTAKTSSAKATQNAGNHSAPSSMEVAQPSLQSPVAASIKGTMNPQVPVHESLVDAPEGGLKMNGHAAASKGAASLAAAAQPSSSGLLDESLKPSIPPPRSGWLQALKYVCSVNSLSAYAIRCCKPFCMCEIGCVVHEFCFVNTSSLDYTQPTHAHDDLCGM